MSPRPSALAKVAASGANSSSAASASAPKARRSVSAEQVGAAVKGVYGLRMNRLARIRREKRPVGPPESGDGRREIAPVQRRTKTTSHGRSSIQRSDEKRHVVMRLAGFGFEDDRDRRVQRWPIVEREVAAGVERQSIFARRQRARREGGACGVGRRHRCSPIPQPSSRRRREFRVRRQHSPRGGPGSYRERGW